MVGALTNVRVFLVVAALLLASAGRMNEADSVSLANGMPSSRAAVSESAESPDQTQKAVTRIPEVTTRTSDRD